jgi:hypothetical protein
MNTFQVMGACVVLIVAQWAAGAETIDWTRTPMRPLPAATDRELPKDGHSIFVDANKGRDDAAGSVDAPLKTLAAAVAKLQPGDTLVLRAGTYYEPLNLNRSGDVGKPITIRAYPKELVILDAGIPEFVDSPADAWEPVLNGAHDEFRSKKTYPDIAPGEEMAVGNFADSMIPLHPYRSGIDLRADNIYWIFSNKTDASQGGLYCGPGLWIDEADHHVYARFSHLELPTLTDRNYTGETDPRKLKLVVAGAASNVTITGQHDLRLQDLVLRGARGNSIAIADAKNVDFDGLTVYGGRSAFRVDRTHDVHVINTAFRGLAAPWSYRNHQKYRGVDTYLIVTGDYAKDPTNLGLSFDFCEFTDHHDALRLDGCRDVAVRHCLIDNFNDDGIDFGPKQTDQHFEITQNLLSRIFQCLTVHRDEKGAGPLVDAKPGSGAYIARNIFDERGLILARLPAGMIAMRQRSDYDYGRPLIDHGTPTWVPLFIYQNTVLLRAPVFRDYYAGGLIIGGQRGTERRILNNLFIHVEDLPGNQIPLAENPADFTADYNLEWSLGEGPDYKGDYLADGRKAKNPKLEWFESSKKTYPAGWTSHDQFADPKLSAIGPEWTDSANVSLQPGSPAIDKGGPIPATWPDPLRQADKASPDLGAIPAGSAPLTFGVHGRYSTANIGKQADQP